MCIDYRTVHCRSLGSVDRRNTLLSLEKSKSLPTDPYQYITDERIVANGFAIRQYKGDVRIVCLEYLMRDSCYKMLKTFAKWA